MSKTTASRNTPSATSGEVRLPSPTGAVELKSGHDESKHVTQSTSEHAAPPGLVCPANTVIDKHRAIISPAQNSLSFFIQTSFQSDFQASRIIQLADSAYNLRRINELELLGQILKLIKGCEYVGAYYHGLAVENQGRGDLDRAKALFEQAATCAPSQYRARAILSLGAVEGYRGRVEQEAEFYQQALSLSESDYYTRIETARAVALLHSLNSDHHRAIADLEALYPLARRFAAFNARLYFDVLNSLAVEYAVIGDTTAARQAIAPVMRSALRDSIPEYKETAHEIQQAERKKIIVTVRKLPKIAVAFRLIFLAKRRILSRPGILSPVRISRTILERITARASCHAPPFKFA